MRKRKMPPFRPLPVHQRKTVSRKENAKFYALIEDKSGRRRRVNFYVNITGYNHHAQDRMIKDVCNRILGKRIPWHMQGEIFTYRELIYETEWVRIKKLLDYEAGVIYEK